MSLLVVPVKDASAPLPPPTPTPKLHGAQCRMMIRYLVQKAALAGASSFRQGALPSAPPAAFLGPSGDGNSSL